MTIAFKQWVFTLTAIDLIAAAGLGREASVGVYLFYTLVTQTLALIPLLAMAVAPRQAAKPVQAAQGVAGTLQSADCDNSVAGLWSVVLV